MEFTEPVFRGIRRSDIMGAFRRWPSAPRPIGAFIKICTYFPYPAKVWVNGHEWAKRQAAHAGIAYTSLPNGFASCDDREALAAICERFGARRRAGPPGTCASRTSGAAAVR